MYTSPLKHWSQNIAVNSMRWKYKIYLMLGTLQLRRYRDFLGSGQWWRRISQAVICTHISRTTWLLPESHLAIDRTTSSRKLSVPWLLVDCLSDRRWSCFHGNLLHKASTKCHVSRSICLLSSMESDGRLTCVVSVATLRVIERSNTTSPDRSVSWKTIAVQPFHERSKLDCGRLLDHN